MAGRFVFGNYQGYLVRADAGVIHHGNPILEVPVGQVPVARKFGMDFDIPEALRSDGRGSRPQEEPEGNNASDKIWHGYSWFFRASGLVCKTRYRIYEIMYQASDIE